MTYAQINCLFNLQHFRHIHSYKLYGTLASLSKSTFPSRFCTCMSHMIQNKKTLRCSCKNSLRYVRTCRNVSDYQSARKEVPVHSLALRDTNVAHFYRTSIFPIYATQRILMRKIEVFFEVKFIASMSDVKLCHSDTSRNL